MPKLSAVQSPLISFVITAASLGAAVGLITNTTDQLIVALVPTLVGNAFVIGAAIYNAITAHTTAVTAAIRGAK